MDLESMEKELKTFRPVGPDPGLGGRIIAGAILTERRRRRWFQVKVGVAAVIAGLVVATHLTDMTTARIMNPATSQANSQSVSTECDPDLRPYSLYQQGISSLLEMTRASARIAGAGSRRIMGKSAHDLHVYSPYLNGARAMLNGGNGSR